LSRYFLDEGTTTYTHVSDQHSTYGTKVIPTTWREAVAVLDEIFGNPTELPLGEHTVDTAGQTLATFAIFQLAGLQFSPRIRDIGRLQLYRLGPGSTWRSRYPHAGPSIGVQLGDEQAGGGVSELHGGDQAEQVVPVLGDQVGLDRLAEQTGNPAWPMRYMSTAG
jgi:TnpA family transposase